MGPSDMGQVMALASLALALVTVAMTTRRDLFRRVTVLSYRVERLI